MPKRGIKLGPNERWAFVDGIKAGLSCPDFAAHERGTLGPIAAQMLTERDSRGVAAYQSAKRMKFKYSETERRMIVQALRYAIAEPQGLVNSSEQALIAQLIPDLEG